MAKGENIFKRKDGRWEARYIKGHELSGKIKYGFCYGKTYKEAKEKAAKCRTELMNGVTVVPKTRHQDFAFYCDEWLRSGKSRLKESTYIKYETILEKHIKPKLGACDPLAVTAELVGRFSEELLCQEALSPKTVRDILGVLGSVIKHISRRLPGMMNVVEIAYPREVKKEMRVLSKEEQKRLVSFLMTDMDSCKFGILLALFTGLRIGELCALRWENISLQERTVKISGTMQRLKNMEADAPAKTKVMIGQPKSGNSSRIIPLMDWLVVWGEKICPENRQTFVLTSVEEFMEPRALQYRLKKYTQSCGLEGVHFHTLRHTFATRCVEVGFEIKSLSDILGHATTTIMLERYVHSSLELKRDNMNKLIAIDVGDMRSQNLVSNNK